MDDASPGLAHALHDGDEVILSTGATATVRGSYPAGYNGVVDIMLDGSAESERADALTLPERWANLNEAQLGSIGVAQSDEPVPSPSGGEARAPSLRMED